MLDYPVHQGVQKLSRDLNAIYWRTPALWELDSSSAGFGWIDANDAQGNVLSFLRFPAAGEAGPADGPEAARVVACLANFAAIPHLDYRIGLPQAGRWLEILNTDASVYGGSGTGNLGSIEAMPEPWHGQPASAQIPLPPMGVIWLTPES